MKRVYSTTPIQRQRLKNGLARLTLYSMYHSLEKEKYLFTWHFRLYVCVCVCAQGENLLIAHWQIICSNDDDDGTTEQIIYQIKKTLLG